MFPILRKFVSLLHQSHKLSPFLAISFELLSSFQILHLILLNMSLISTRNNFLVEALAKNIRFFTAGYHFDQYSELSPLFLPVWILCISFLLFHLILLFLNLLLVRAKFTFRLPLIITNLICQIHTKILFFPFLFFFFLLIRMNQTRFCESSSNFYCNFAWNIFTIIFSGLNFLLAIIPEFILYQRTKGLGFYASKTNLYHQFVLIYKGLFLILLIAIEPSDTLIKITAILQFLFNLVLLYILYRTLPFYKFTILKIAIITSTLSLCLSLISAIQVFTRNTSVEKGIQVITPILPIFAVKIALSQFKRLFCWILHSRNLSVPYAIHFHLLLREFTENDRTSRLSDKAFFPEMSTFSGVLAYSKINFTQLRNQRDDEEEKIRLYEHSIERLEHCLKKHPKSETLIVFLARIYLKKHNNFAKSLELVRRLQANETSIHVVSSLDLLTYKLMEIDNAEGLKDEKQLNLDTLFKYKNLTKQLKLRIKKEIQKHWDFWRDLQKGSIDIKEATNRVEEIDDLYLQIQRQFLRSYSDFQYNFQLPILMYAVYLNNLRHLPQEAAHHLNKFHAIVSNQVPKNDINIYSETTAITIISLEPKKAGLIIDVTEAVQNIFKLKKSSVVGFNFGLFFPSGIANAFQQELFQYAKNPTTKLDHKYKTYGKTVDGDLFELEAHFKVHSHFEKEPQAALILKQLSKPQPVFLVNYDGDIIEYSKVLEEKCGKENFKVHRLRSVNDLTIEFEEINRAFNTCYGRMNRDSTEQTVVNTTTLLFDKCDDSKKNRTVTDQEDVFKNPSKFTTDTNTELPILNSISDDGNLIVLNSGKKESQRALIKQGIANGFSAYFKRNMRNEMPLDKAKQVCQTFEKGKRIVLSSKNATPLRKAFRLRGLVQVKPHIIDGQLFKVFRIKDIKRDDSWDQQSDDESQIAHQEKSEVTFADEFPIDFERQQQNKKVVLFATGVSMGSTKEKNSKAQNTLVDSQVEIKSNESDSGLGFRSHQVSLKNPVVMDDQKSSVMDYTYKENRFIKLLKEITLRKKLLPSLKLTMFISYIVLLFITTLTAVSYWFSHKSILEVERGVQIVNYATESLVNTEKAWGWLIMLYATGLGVTNFSPDMLYVFKTSIYFDMMIVQNATRQIKTLLSQLDATEFLEEAFQKNIAMYNPLGLDPAYKDEFDFFIATDVLTHKILSMIIYNQEIELVMREDTLFNLNNTANDYMIRSRDLIHETEDFLESLISRNLKVLKIVLVSQGIALLLLAVSLVGMSRVMMKAYRRFFQALVRIREESVLNQIKQLDRIKKYFEEDETELKTFIQASYDLLDESRGNLRVKTHSSVAAKRVGQFHSRKMNIHLFSTTAVSFTFVPVLVGLFCGSLFSSMSAFESFQRVADQIGVLSEAMDQSNMFLSSFAYGVLFGTIPTMLIQNTAPFVQLNENLALFDDLNNKLAAVFLHDDFEDQTILDILKDTVCSYLEEDIQAFCQIATKDGLNGLMTINVEYLQVSLFYINRFLADPTLLNAMQLSAGYIAAANPPLSTMNNAYPFMVTRIMTLFHQSVEDTEDSELRYFMAVLMTILVSIAFIHVFSIQRLRKADFSRRKILKIIPFNVIQENKVVGFYILNSFGREAEGLKNVF